MILEQIIENRFRSAAIIGLGKNTGKTFTLNQLLVESRRLGVTAAITSAGLDGEERDSLANHAKPRILVSPGQIVATAKTLLLASGLDYKILSMTGIMTQLGEVVLARAKSYGQILLAGPGTRHGLIYLQEGLRQFDYDLLLIDGAVDRRSLSAPTAADTAILAVGAEAAWERPRLLEKLGLQWRLLTLPPLQNGELVQQLEDVSQDVRMAVFSGQDLQHTVYHSEIGQCSSILAECGRGGPLTVFIRGMLTDELLKQVLINTCGALTLTILVPDPTHVFLSKRAFHHLAAGNGVLKVQNPIRISAVTVNPFNSRYGYAEPMGLLADIGDAVHPVPCYDLFLGLRYEGG